jgi:nucleoside-diphosphate-sugar epimerase
MKIQLIGGAGFIGSVLSKQLLQHGHTVSLFDKKCNPGNIESYFEGDVRNSSDLEKGLTNDTDWVVLLAAEHADNVSPVSLYYDVNVQGTKNVLSVMRNKGINNIVFTSTVAVYGLDKPNPDEKFPTNPENHYGKSKLQAEKLLLEWQAEFPEKRNLIIIRPTVVFGPGNRGNVYNLIRQIVSGRFLMIGNGQNVKSMAYVENIAAFIRYTIEKKLQGLNIFNYTDKPDLTTNEIINAVQKALGKKQNPLRIPYSMGYSIGVGFDLLSKITGKSLPISSYRIKKFCATTMFSSQKVQEIGFKPLVTLEEGIFQTVASIKQEEKINPV